MRCSQARQRLATRFEVGTMSEDPQLVDDHLATCAECQAFGALLEGTDTALAALGPSEPPADLATRAADAALRAETRPGLRESFVDRLVPIAWPAAAVAVSVAMFLLLSSAPDTAAQAQDTEAQEDPIAAIVELPQELSDPEIMLFGGE